MIPVARLMVRLAGQKVGMLGLGERGRIYFQYDPDWIVQGFDLAPGSLDFNLSVQLPKRPEIFDGLHGVFHDSLPGRRPTQGDGRTGGRWANLPVGIRSAA
jgi:serine/threonine-protein kinase HipA